MPPGTCEAEFFSEDYRKNPSGRPGYGGCERRGLKQVDANAAVTDPTLEKCCDWSMNQVWDNDVRPFLSMEF